MKIGIITWFRYENYGTKLQAIALQNYLSEEGYIAELIDFKVPVPSKSKKQKLYIRFFRRLNFCVLQFAKKVYKNELSIRSKRMESIIQEMCLVSKEIRSKGEFIEICNQVDLIICGSDQIWNPNWYDPYYFADFPEIKTRKISYAPSIGVQEIPEYLKPSIKDSLKNFSLITVREEKASMLLEPLIGYRPLKVLDPTMLFSGQEWQKRLRIIRAEEKKEPYILCYFLSDNRNHFLAAKRFATERNLQIKLIPQEGFSFFQKAEKYPEAGVREFLELILNSKYVITDSFHGTVFSILFEKELYVFERFKNDKFFSQNDRVRELMNQFGLEERLIAYNSKRIFDKKNIDFKKVNCHLDYLKLQSKNILDYGVKMQD